MVGSCRSVAGSVWRFVSWQVSVLFTKAAYPAHALTSAAITSGLLRCRRFRCRRLTPVSPPSSNAWNPTAHPPAHSPFPQAATTTCACRWSGTR